jgi:subtilase family serine protease
VNSSFGLCELYYTAAYNGGTDFTSILQLQHDIFRQGNAQGITFVEASGDNGAYDCFDPTFSYLVKGVENPADDTATTAVGGTNLVTKSIPGSRDSAYVRESAFADPYDPSSGAPPGAIFGSGGGISVLFPKPWYQELVNTHARTRTVPDVAMHMGGCPVGAATPCNPDDSAVLTVVGGGLYEVVGTSASSPEFAGLLAVTEQTLGTRLGNADGYIYALSLVGSEAVYRQDIPGNNGYPTSHGYNYVLGNGTPHAAVFAARPLAPRAGVPWTPSNP